MIQNKRKQKEKPNYSMFQNAAFMVKIAWNNKKSVLVICVLLALTAVAINMLELFITPVILRKVEQGVPIMELLTTIVVFTLVLLGMRALQSYLETNALYGRIDIRTLLIDRVIQKYVTMSYPMTEDPEVEKKISKADMTLNSNRAAGEAIWESMTELLKNLLGFGLYFSLLATLQPILIGVILVTSAASYLMDRHFAKWGFENREELSGYEKKLGYIHNKLTGKTAAKDIRMFGMTDWLDEVYRKSFRLYQNFYVQRELRNLWGDLADVVLTVLRNGLAYFYLINMTLTGKISASEFLLYFTAVNGFSVWVKGLLSRFSEMHRQSLELCTLREFLDMPEIFKLEEGEPVTPVLNIGYELQMKNVSFRYPGAQEDTISHMNLTIAPGEKLAVVGLNGAGKTTLIKLLCGLYDPTDGEILLNGKNIRQFRRREYYQLFSAVFQQFSALDISLEENVAQSVFDIDYEKVRDCVEKAGLSETVKKLPQGYQTKIGRQVWTDGMELSGGQMQRLMLARALYKDAPVILLDEPTAALDPLAEQDLYERYNELTAGRTSVYISHRLASTQFCDRILYLEHGRIAEEGTHDALLMAGGKYAELFRIQGRYYQEGKAY